MLISSEMHQCLWILIIIIILWICNYRDDCFIFQITWGITYQIYLLFFLWQMTIPTLLVPVFWVCVHVCTCTCFTPHAACLEMLTCSDLLPLIPVPVCPEMSLLVWRTYRSLGPEINTVSSKRHYQTAWLHRSSLKLSYVSSFQHCVAVLTWESNKQPLFRDCTLQLSSYMVFWVNSSQGANAVLKFFNLNLWCVGFPFLLPSVLRSLYLI